MLWVGRIACRKAGYACLLCCCIQHLALDVYELRRQDVAQNAHGIGFVERYSMADACTQIARRTVGKARK